MHLLIEIANAPKMNCQQTDLMNKWNGFLINSNHSEVIDIELWIVNSTKIFIWFD